MCYSKTIFVALLVILFAIPSFGQKSKGAGKSFYTRDRYSGNKIRMSRSKSKIVCPVFENTGYPYHGLGIKVGDPFALTYKYYPNKKYSFAVDFGKAASGLYSRYYREMFFQQINTDSIPPERLEDSNFTYVTHDVKTDIVAEVKVLRHFNAEKISPGLQLYIGLGWEWRSLKLRYDYLYSSQFFENEFNTFEMSRSTHGVQGVLGIEYSYFQLPISAFMELEFYNDIGRDPGWRRVQGGVGLRYVF